MSELDGSCVQPLRMSEIDQHAPPSPDPDGDVCRIKPLEKPRSTRKKSARLKRTPSMYVDDYAADDVEASQEPMSQLEQQEYRPENNKPIASSSSQQGEDLKCTICGVQYQSHKLSYFKAHMLQHTCPICKTALPFYDLVNHVKLHLVNRSSQEGKLDIPCSLCRKRFKTLTNYDAHMSQVHRCPVCEKCFRRKEVIDHMRTHFGQDGTINLDNAATVEAIMTQGQGDVGMDSEDEGSKNKKESNVRKQSSPEKRKHEENSSEDEVEEDDSPAKARLVVKIQKALKRSRSKSLSENEEDDEEEFDQDFTDIKEQKDDDNNDPGAGDSNKKHCEDNDKKGSEDKTQDKMNDKTPDKTNQNSDQSNQAKLQPSQIKKEPKDEDLELSGFNLEEIDGDHDENLYDDLNDDDYGGETSSKSIKLARAQYHQEIAERVSTVIKDNKCTMCGVSTQYPNRIRKHVRKVHYCNFCDQFFDREVLPIHMKEHDSPGKKYICRFCGEHCLSSLKLHYHDCYFTKKTALFYHCKICGEKLTSRDGLTMHLRLHDPSDFPAEWEKQMCQLCGFIFIGRSNLVRHMQSRKCTQCGLQTVSSCQHQKHMLSNHHSSAYQCSSCEVQFLSQHSYVDHVTARECSGCSETIEPSCEYLKHEALCKTGRQRSSDTLELLCLKCDAIFVDTYVYDCHVRDHGKMPGKYCCKNCNTQFNQNRDFGIHMSKRECLQCHAKFQPMCKWNEHTCFKMEPPSERCPNCQKVFYKVLSFRNHCKILTCGECPHLAFNSVCTINRHFETEHPGKNLIMEEPETPPRDMRPKIKQEKVSDQEDMEDDDDIHSTKESQWTPSPSPKLITNGCDFCEKFKQPTTQSKLRKHLNGGGCQICKETVAPLCKLKLHYVQCAYNLAPSEANKELLSNDGSRPAHCPLCRMHLQTINGLKSHLRIGDFECEECGEKFVGHCVFRRHQLKTKHGRKDNICPICSKGFQYSRDLKKHLLIHTGERPYGCLICGNSYRNPGHLSYHLKVQHGGARPYKCKYCGRGFGALSGCSKHEKRHEKTTKNKCEHCGMMFVAAHSLTKHLATRVCLIVDKDTPQMLPNLLDDHVPDNAPFTPDDSSLSNHTNNHLPHNDNDDSEGDMDEDEDEDEPEEPEGSDLESDPGSDPDFIVQATKAIRRIKKKSLSTTPKENHIPNHENSLCNDVKALENKAVVKEEPLSE